MTINDFDQSIQKEEKVEIGTGSNKPISQPVGEEMVYKKVAETLGLDNFSEMEKYKDQIKMIADYVKSQGGEDVTDFAWHVKQLEMRIGTPALGEKSINNVARYVYLLTENERIKSELDKMGAIQ